MGSSTGVTVGERPRILWLIKGLGPGGAEQLLVSFAKVADHAAFDYHAGYLVPWKSTLVPDLEARGVTVHPLGGPARVGVRWPLRLRRLLREVRPAVLHLHSPSVAAVARLLVLTLPRLARPVVVSTEHNTWDSYSPITRLSNALTSPLDAARWAVSHRVEDSIWPRLRRRTTVLVHGIVPSEHVVDSAQARSELRAEWGVGDDDVVFCTVANFRPNKSYPNLLQAARDVIDRCDRAYFVTVGQGPLEAQVRDLHAELGLGDRLRLLGYRRDVSEILSACDAFVLASEHEGFPIALMEALAAGLPVVATDVGGVPDAVDPGQEGLLVPRNNPQALADAILELARSPDRRARMAAAAARRGTRFDIRHAVAEIEERYASEISIARAAASAG